MKAKRERGNKFKGVMWDYYMTNREITKAYDEEYKKQTEKQKWTRNEKIWLGICIFGAVALALRFVVF